MSKDLRGNIPVEPSQNDPAPPWGYLPVEQYLIRKWDHESGLPNDRQRQALVRAFLEEDVLDPELCAAVRNRGKVSRKPSELEIRDILRPLRPGHIRKVAIAYVDFHRENWEMPTYIRTYYGGGTADEEEMLEWIPIGDRNSGATGVEEENFWWRVLNDKSLFDFGDNWSTIYNVLPEVVAYREDRRPNLDSLNVLRSAKYNVGDDSWTEKVAESVQNTIQGQSRNTLIIFDKTFFDTFDLTEEQIYAMPEEECVIGPLLVFLDKKGNQIRASRVSSDAQEMLEISYFRCSTDELGFWRDGIVGDKYKPEGEIGRQYYGSQAPTEWTTPPAVPFSWPRPDDL